MKRRRKRNRERNREREKEERKKKRERRKEEWIRKRWDKSQTMKGSAHPVRKYGLYTESSLKLLNSFSQLSNVIIFEL